VLVSLGLSALIFYGFHLLEAPHAADEDPDRGAAAGAERVGRNALLLYLLHGVVIGLFALPPVSGVVCRGAVVADRCTGCRAVRDFSAIGLYLDRRKPVLDAVETNREPGRLSQRQRPGSRSDARPISLTARRVETGSSLGAERS